MSNYLRLVCLDHNPPIRSREESGQHLYDLPQIREDVASRKTLLDFAKADWLFGLSPSYRNNSLDFFEDHPTCRLWIRSEYGEGYDPEGTDETPKEPS